MTNEAAVIQMWEAIASNQLRFDQSSWVKTPCSVLDGLKEGQAVPMCGTTMCSAGWAMHLSGEFEVVREHGLAEFRRTDTHPAGPGPLRDGYASDDEAWEHSGYTQAGRRLLGLTADQADELFVKTMTDDIDFYRERLAAITGVPLERLRPVEDLLAVRA